MIATEPIVRDEKLVILYRQSQQPCHFEELFERFRPEITRFTARLLVNRPEIDSEAVTSEVFAAFHTYCKSTQPVRPVRAWLHTAAQLRVREAIRTRQRVKRGGAYQRRQLNLDELQDAADRPSVCAERRELIDLIRAATGSLTEFDQEIVRLFYAEALSTSQIAKQLGVAQKTIKRHLAAIRSRLRQHILASA